MEFPHMARWNHVQMIEDFGSIMPTGYLTMAAKSSCWSILSYCRRDSKAIFKAKPGDTFARVGSRKIRLRRRTWATRCSCSNIAPIRQVTTKTDMFGYSPVLAARAPFSSAAAQDRFPDQPITFDDFLGRDAWEFTWRIIGTDVPSPRPYGSLPPGRQSR